MAGTDGRAAARPGQRRSGRRRESARAAWGERVAAEARQHEAFASWAESDMPPEALQQRRAASQRRLLGHVVGGDYDAARELALAADLGAARRAGGPLDAHVASALVVGASLKRLLCDADPDAGGGNRALDIAREWAGTAGGVTAALLASAEAARYPLRKVDSASVFPFDEPRTEAGAALHVQRTWRGHAGRRAWFTKTTAQLQNDIVAQVAACDRSLVDVLSPKLRQRCKHALAQTYTDISGTCTLRGKVRRFTFVCVIELTELKREVQAVVASAEAAARYPLRKVDSASVFPFDEPRTEAGAALHVQRTWRGHAGRRAWFTKTTAQLQNDIVAQVAACDRSLVDVLSPKLRQRCKHALAQTYTDISGTCTLRGKVRRFTFVCVIELTELKREVQAVREHSAPLLPLPPPRPAALESLLRVAEQAVKEASTLSERLHSSALLARMQAATTVEEAALLMQQTAFHMAYAAEPRA